MQVCAVIAVVLAWWLRARLGAAGVVAIAAALTSLAAGLGATLAAHACERCHRRVGARHLDADQRRALGSLRTRAAVGSLIAMLVAMGAGMIAVAIGR